MSIRRRINVEISTTVEISMLFRRPSKYSYVFQRFFDDRRNFDVDSTLNQRRNARWDRPMTYFCRFEERSRFSYTHCVSIDFVVDFFSEAEYAYKKNRQIIPMMFEEGFEPTDWLGFIMGTDLYYRAFTDELLEEEFVNLVRKLGNKGRATTEG